mgnify:CR=1 FL=1
MAIDEKKLIEYLETLAEFERKKSQESAEIGAFDMATCYGHGEYCYKNAINAAEEQPKIDGWIPCSERLPEENEEVICCFKSGVVKALVLFNCKFHGKVYAYEKSDIIAWQPLPEAYHG